MFTRIIFFMAFLLPSMVGAVESGDSCTVVTKLPSHMVCFYDLVVNCNDPNGRGRNENLLCADADRQAADKKLNQVYQRIVRRLSGKSKASLIEAQRAWVKFMLADCDNYVSQEFLDGGSGQDQASAECKSEMTKNRIQTLEQRYGVK